MMGGMGTSMSSRMGEQHQPQQTSVFAKMQGMGTGMHGGMGNMGSNMGAMGGSMGMARKMGKGGMGGMNNMNSMNNMGGMMNSGMGGMGGGMGGMAGGMCGQGMQGMGGMGMAQGNEKGKMGAGGMCGMTMGAMGQKGMGKPMGCKGDSNGCGAQGRPPIGGSMGQRPPVMAAASAEARRISAPRRASAKPGLSAVGHQLQYGLQRLLEWELAV
ncbi:unnamed protein product [Symbiodinium sp. CCMP2456]|nr:unnamed protein product [Symbiodinium sp. CCMP2456]